MMLPIFIAVYAWINPLQDGKGSSVWGSRLRGVVIAVAPFPGVSTLVYAPLRVWALKGFAHTVTQVDLRTEILTRSLRAALLFAPADRAPRLELLSRHSLHFCADVPRILPAAHRGARCGGSAGCVVFPHAPRSAFGGAHS